MKDSTSTNSLDDAKAEINKLLKNIIKKIAKGADGDDDDGSSVGSEASQPSVSLSMIDRNLAVQAYMDLLSQKSAIDRKNDLLVKSLLKYFKRKKVYRALSVDKEDELPDLMKKYYNSLDEFDETMATDKKFRQITAEKVNQLEEEKSELTVQKLKTIEGLEGRLIEIGTSLQSSKSGQFMPLSAVMALINRMRNVRKIISQERIKHIITLDKHTEIDHKAKALEDLGNGLRMIDFEQLRAERQTLGYKIEERNNELEKLRVRCYSETQILSHVREKEFMLANQIVEEEEDLELAMVDLSILRNELNDVKLKRDKLRKLFSELSESCGLLDKGVLLRDYDNTMDEAHAKQAEIDTLKLEIEMIAEEHRHILMQIDKRALVKTDSMKFDEKLKKQLDYMRRPYLPRIQRGIPYARTHLRKRKYQLV